MSQMPEMPAAGWAEQDYDRSAYPPQAEAQPAQNAAHTAAHNGAGWQQDTEPDWGASQQGYPEQDYPAQDYAAQDYSGQGYQQQGQEYQHQQQGQQAYPGHSQAQAYQEQQAYPAFPAAVPEADSGAGLPTEFDHLFRDSTPDSRRAIDRQKPMVGGAGAGYLAASQNAAAAAPDAMIPDQSGVAPQPGQYQPYSQSFPQPQDGQYNQVPGQYQGEQYQATQLQSGGYAQPPQAEYQQGAGYGEPGGGFGGGPFDNGPLSNGTYGGGGLGGRLRDRRTLIIGGAVAVAAIIGIVIATSGGGSPPSRNTASGGGTPTAVASKTTPKQQADQIYQLIQQSGQLRSDANGAVVDVNGCKDLSNAQNTLTSTAQKRQAQADNVSKLDVSGIQNGAQLVSQLKAAWTASSQYDTAYAQIAGDVQTHCKSDNVHKDSNQQAANQAAGTADTAKAQAAQLWNANVATPLGESQVSSDKL